MKIHAIQTGTVTVKTRQPRGVGHGRRRVLNTLLDRAWTPPVPIYAFAIEHPEGVIVVDTGETARAAEPGYFPRWHPFFRFGLRESVTPEQEIGPQLRRLGIEPEDVRRVILTHMHTDHAGGLHHFPRSEILASRRELADAAGRLGRLRGYVNNRYPATFDPTPVDLRRSAYGAFPESLRVTAAGDVIIVGLPGHTPGHIGVLVEEGERAVLLAGDSAYSQPLLLEGVVDGVAPHEDVYRRTADRIRTFAQSTPTVFLVCHDPDSGARLERRATL